MFSAALTTFVLVLAFVAQECTTGPISDFVDTYTVTVTNYAKETAFVSIVAPDTQHSITLAPGATTSVDSFEAGVVTIVAYGFDLQAYVDLSKLQSELQQKLTNPKLSKDEIDGIVQQIKDINAKLHAPARQDQPGFGSCTFETSNTDKNVDAGLSLRNLEWQLSGC